MMARGSARRIAFSILLVGLCLLALFGPPGCWVEEIAGSVYNAESILSKSGSVWDGTDSLPSDSELIARFQHHRGGFETLRQMWAQEDPQITELGSCYLYTTYTLDGVNVPDRIGSSLLTNRFISQFRWNRYRLMFLYLGIQEVRGGPKTMKLPVAGSGCATCDDVFKGFTYLPLPPKHLENSLDGLLSKAQKRGEPYDAYRHVEGNWYIYLEFLPG